MKKGSSYTIFTYGYMLPEAIKACEILENRTLRSSLSAAGPTFIADKYSMDKMVNQTLKLYNFYFDIYND